MKLVLFALSGQRFALPLAAVDRFVPAVEVLALPGAPAIVLGAVNVGGSILPVFCVRRRFGIEERAVSPDQLLLLGRTSSRSVALIVDETHGVVECPDHEIVRPEQVGVGLNLFQGVAKLADGMVLIHNLERFLSAQESLQLTEAMEQGA